jgi:hypothetical protein
MTKRRRRKKPTRQQELAWMLVGAGAAMLATTLVEKSLKAGWRYALDEDPPGVPEDLSTGWKDALIWTAVSAVVVGVSQTLAKRGAAMGWQRALGTQPPRR